MKIDYLIREMGCESNGVCCVAPPFTRAIAKAGGDITIFTLEPTVCIPGCRMRFFHHDKFPHPEFFASRELYRTLKTEARNCQIFHSNLLWQAVNIYPEFARRGTPCRHVISPHGTLSQWALNRSRLKKTISKMLGQQAALQNADMFHATAPAEYREIRNLGFKQPVAVIPNGIEIPENLPPKQRHGTATKKLLFLGRIHPKKGVDFLLDAWRNLAPHFPDWELEIAGPLNSYALELQQRYRTLRGVSFCGEIKGHEKFVHYSDASLFVLPTHSENFGMTIGESLICGTPVITTREAPWPEIEKKQCGWWINDTRQDLQRTLSDAMQLNEEQLLVMGQRGQEWIRKEFSWDAAGEKMMAAYQWLCGTGPLPPEVIPE